jgi:hypothetical protein
MFKVVAIGGWSIALVYLVYGSIYDYLARRSRRQARREERAARKPRKKRR